jgi:hypothetical protein
MLMIDSYHHPNHMQRELDTHKHFVSKYIIAHDTEVLHGKKNNSLFLCLAQFAEKEGWDVVEHVQLNVGYAVIKKK